MNKIRRGGWQGGRRGVRSKPGLRLRRGAGRCVVGAMEAAWPSWAGTSISDMKATLTGQPKKTELQQLKDDCCCKGLSWEMRLWGFGTCVCIGYALTVGSLFRLSELLDGNPMPFGVCYSIGNTLELFSTMFLVGPWRQLQNIFAKTRWFASLIYVLSIVGTLVLCFIDVPEQYDKERTGGIIFCICLQFCALMWYCLSWIPYGRDMLLKCCKRCCAS